ncbi:MAG: FAD-binding oxidoreductase, partial [Bacteroidetes bacterium]|nr:FAD-binding oxidoreductase [Bacteroidota bacterium]
NSCLASSELLIKSYRNFFEESGDLLTEEFDPAHLTIDPECINYKGNTAKKIIFCEGYRGMNNPYFSFLPFQPTKGDVLIVKIPNANFDKIFKQRIFVMPIGDDLYWAGATHERDFIHDQPTDEKREHLIKKLHDILTIPFEIVEHKAAIRPTVRDRRPFIGLHPDHTSVAIFNGLGTKGASLAPFWAKHVTDFLIHSVELDREVDIRRFLK